MASQVEIANRALTKLGAARIISLSDDSKTAGTIAAIYDTVLASELRDHRWHFSKARAKLPALTAVPAFDYARQFQLPTDYLALRQIGHRHILPRIDYRALYSLEDRRILTDLPAPLQIIYTRSMTDPTYYDALFVEVLACRLAMEGCEAITQSSTKFDRVANQYQLAVRAAVRANAIELPPELAPDDTWLTSRR